MEEVINIRLTPENSYTGVSYSILSLRPVPDNIEVDSGFTETILREHHQEFWYLHGTGNKKLANKVAEKMISLIVRLMQPEL